MAIEGSLKDVNLADICQLLAMGRKTGCLSVTDRSNFGYVYFADGRVIHASVLNRPDRLGELLVRNAVISREDLSRAMEAQAHRSERVGQILVGDGALTEEELHHYISLQIEEAVYHLFTWSQGAFHFDPDQRPDEEGMFLVDIPAESLLLEGARRVDEWELIEKKVPSFDLVFAVVKDPDAPDVADDFQLSDSQRRLLPLIDGERSAHDLVSESGMVEFEVGKALYGLIQAGFVDKAGRRAPEEGSGGDERIQERMNLGFAFYRSGMMEDAIREFESVLELDPTNDRAHFNLGLIALRARRPDQALERFEAMPAPARRAYGVLRNRALALELVGRYDEALDVLRRAAEARPEAHDTQLAMGILLVKMGEPEEALGALGEYRKSPRLRRPGPLYYTYAVLASALAGDLDYATQAGREGLTHFPSCGPLLVNTGAVLERAGQLDAARALYVRALEDGQPPPQAHKNLGDQAYASADFEQARVHYEKAVKLDSRLGDDIYLRLGSIAYRDDERDVARLLWRRALEINPENELVRESLGLLEEPV